MEVGCFRKIIMLVDGPFLFSNWDDRHVSIERRVLSVFIIAILLFFP